jgi:hypothetical protein
LAKKARVYDGTAWQELASAQTDLTAYSTTAQMNTSITAGVGLVPILTQTIGTAVSSVTVTNAFSATYDVYKIVISGGVGSTAATLNLKLGATTTGYYSGLTFAGYTGGSGVRANNNAAQWVFLSSSNTNIIQFNMDIINPFLAKNTIIDFMYTDAVPTGDGGRGAGYLNNTTSYTDFTLTPSTGTLTGGTIRVYGYKN